MRCLDALWDVRLTRNGVSLCKIRFSKLRFVSIMCFVSIRGVFKQGVFYCDGLRDERTRHPLLYLEHLIVQSADLMSRGNGDKKSYLFCISIFFVY